MWKEECDKAGDGSWWDGSLIRSLGGWSAVKALRHARLAEKGDEWIVGSGEFA